MSKSYSEYSHNIALNAEEQKADSSTDADAYIHNYYDAEEESILAFCYENCISCFISGTELVVVTPVSLWKIIVDGPDHHIFLYHKNDPGSRENPEHDLVPGYHAQNCSATTIVGFFKYIIAHDLYREKNPACKRKKNGSAPKKGTRRYKSATLKQKKIHRREDTRHVLNLIDSLHEKIGS